MTTNPYAAPKAAVADETLIVTADFIPEGRSLDAGRGWAWIAEGWNLFKKQPGLWIGMILLLGVILFALALVPFLGTLLTVLLWPVFVGGIVVGCRALDQGGELEIGHLFAGFRERVGPLMAVGALSLAATLAIVVAVGLVMGIGMFAMMGSPESIQAMGMTMILAMLVMLALLLPVMMATWFAPPLVVFHELGAVDAIKASFVGCLKNIVPFLIYGVILLGFSVLATLPALLGWLVLGPVMAASVYTAYRDIYFKPRQ